MDLSCRIPKLLKKKKKKKKTDRRDIIAKLVGRSGISGSCYPDIHRLHHQSLLVTAPSPYQSLAPSINPSIAASVESIGGLQEQRDV